MRIERVAAFGHEGAQVGKRAVALQLAQLRGVREHGREVVEHAGAQRRVVHRPGDFHAFVQVARHKVGARQEHRGFVAHAERVDARVLEQAANHAHDANVLGFAGNAGNQARNAAHQHGDLHACAACLGELLDHVAVGNRVALHEDAGGLAGLRLRDFAVDGLAHARLDHERRHTQFLIVARRAFQLHAAEEARGILANHGVGGNHGKVGVELGGFLVVIARAELRDELQAAFAAARDGADLRVHLVIVEAVDDVASGLLKALGPLDVVALVETRAQLEQRGHVFAVFGRGNKGLSQARLACQAVQRDFDAHDIGVDGGFLEQLHERVHSFIRVREQHVAAKHLVGDALFARKRCGPLRACRFVHERLGNRLGGLAHKGERVTHVERHANGVGLLLLQAELFAQEFIGGVRQWALAFEANGGQAAALFQDALHMAAEVLVVFVGFFGRIEIGVARDLNHVGVFHRVHLEDFVGDHFERVLEQDERVFAVFARELDHARAVARHGDDAHEHVFGRFGVRGFALGLGGIFGQRFGFGFLIEAHGDIQRAVFQVGEWVRCVDDLGRYERQHVAVQVIHEFAVLGGRELVGVELVDARVVEQVARLAEIFGGDGREFAHARIHGVELFARRHAGLRVEHDFFRQLKVGKAADAHHEEFLQVAAPNGDEFQALEQGDVRVDGLVEHALVELEPRKLAVLHVGLVRRAHEFFLETIGLRLLGLFRVVYLCDSGLCFVFLTHDIPPSCASRTGEMHQTV